MKQVRRQTREQYLRSRILDRYISLRKFAAEADIPYSSMLTILSRGIGGASFDTMMKICCVLDMDPTELEYVEEK
ncbi:MAG: helix-turn-helix transcriptional regulator [Clostridia bacterium]|nr:helix-turn-helix transcriptional regulator [Clostridia bacterium]